MNPISFKRHRFPPDIIRYAVWLCARRLAVALAVILPGAGWEISGCWGRRSLFIP